MCDRRWAAGHALNLLPRSVEWWLERVAIDADQYLPPNKQKYAHLHKKVGVAVSAW